MVRLDCCGLGYGGCLAATANGCHDIGEDRWAIRSVTFWTQAGVYETNLIITDMFVRYSGNGLVGKVGSVASACWATEFKISRVDSAASRLGIA